MDVPSGEALQREVWKGLPEEVPKADYPCFKRVFVVGRHPTKRIPTASLSNCGGDARVTVRCVVATACGQILQSLVRTAQAGH
jgi:hypothetical protein